VVVEVFAPDLPPVVVARVAEGANRVPIKIVR